ncbi:unnamed protein product [Rotaria socialis]|uniref:DUF4709 domain-containing protein n=1 Tax=Rotaria socialis TaxID=392032 RepID=A0A818AXK8_9BILA|nr:unnamed protein product [Rotaria socialis]CAF3405455.1 unnamed protein product [Rotaria socialis]CAF3440471.1 unnamed protein product [Rotaria socialis]CAF3701101.1 unnamed protein product [Rotaria socialis]CAF4221570.1 unnamed protein product [Rotaria socialis]
MSAPIPIADQLYVGLYCLDCACQTDQDEIVQLKNTTELLGKLYHEIEWLKSELTFTRDSLRSSFYEELQSNGQQIYYQLTDKLDALRKNHSKALETLRLSYRSQLHDFISQARSIINSDKPTSSDSIAPKQESGMESREKSFFNQAAMKGYETEIAALKKEIEQLQETTQHEIKIATGFLSDEKDRLTKELANANRTIAQSEDAVMKKEEQIRDLKRDLSNLQIKLKESKKVTMREPTPTPAVTTQSRLAQTDPWIPSPVNDKSDDANKEFEAMMQTKVEALEHKYQTIMEQKNAQIQQLMQELDIQQKTSKVKLEKYITMDERHRNDMKRQSERHKQEIQMWETKYEILKKSMTVLRDEMYTRQTHVRDRFTAKPAVVTYN